MWDKMSGKRNEGVKLNETGDGDVKRKSYKESGREEKLVDGE